MSTARMSDTKRVGTGSKLPTISKLTLRLLFINVLAVVILAGGILYLDQFQRGLMIERLEALQADAGIIAAALGETAVIPRIAPSQRNPTLPQKIDPLLNQQERIDPLLSQQVLQRLVPPIQCRARLFSPNGALVADTRLLGVGGAEVSLRELPPPIMINAVQRWAASLNNWINRSFRSNLQQYVEHPDQTAHHYPVAAKALTGDSNTSAQRFDNGSVIILAAAPVQRYKQVVGALLLTADTDDIDARVRSVRGDILLLSGLSFLVTVLLSIYLSWSIARPIRLLAAGADRVTRDLLPVEDIPDLSSRNDEIGDLSISLRTMTEALQDRINAVERFAADVAHELKNPLSSIRSAAETMQRVDGVNSRSQLTELLQDDIRRMDRLITDISAASRLDAELARELSKPVDLREMLTIIIEVYAARSNSQNIQLNFSTEVDEPILVTGIEERLAQVFQNLVDNAVSFSPQQGSVTIILTRHINLATVTIEDEGPGLPADNTNRVFERFYSERPTSEKFGNHSGLGLSIAKQIIEAHGGEITGSNRTPINGPPGKIYGACFTVTLPLLHSN